MSERNFNGKTFDLIEEFSMHYDMHKTFLSQLKAQLKSEGNYVRVVTDSYGRKKVYAAPKNSGK